MEKDHSDAEDKSTKATASISSSSSGAPDLLSMVAQCAKGLTVFLVVFAMGHYGFSFSWILLGFLVWVGRERWKGERDAKFSIARAFALDEQREIRARLQFLPSWVLFPETERAEWLNKMVRQLWPFVGDYVKNYIKDHLEPNLRETLASTLKMSSFKFDVIDLGDVPLRIGGINVFRDSVSRHEIIMDIEVYYSGDCYFKVSMTKFKAGIKDIQFHAKVRVIMKPLVNKIPLVGGVQVFFLTPPDINFNLTDIANVFDLPGFADMLRKAVSDVLCNMMLLPNRFSMKLIDDVSGILLHFPEPKGVLRIDIIEAKELMKKDIGILGKSDPYCKISVAGHEFRTPTINNTINPLWNYTTEVIVDDHLQGQTFDLDIHDSDQGNKDDFLGSFSIAIDEVAKKGTYENWIRLRDADSGQVHARLTWFSLSSDVIQLQRLFDPAVKKLDLSNAVLIVYVDSAKGLPNAPKSASEPSPFVKLALGDTKYHTDPRQNTHDPVWEKGFCFLVKDPEVQDLSLELVDKKSEKVIGTLLFRIRNLLTEEDMTKKLQPFPLKYSGYESTITLCLQLKALVKEAYDDSQAPPPMMAPLISPKTPVKAVPSNDNSPSKNQAPSLDEHMANVLGPLLTPVQVDSEVIETATRKRQGLLHETSDSGNFSVQLTLRYSMQRQMLVVVVHKVINVPITNSSDLPDPYVKLLILPSPAKDSKQKTSVLKNNVNPVYDETFEYSMLPGDVNNRTLQVSVCSRSSSSIFGRCLVLGKAVIDLVNLDLSNAITEWFEVENTEDDEGGND